MSTSRFKKTTQTASQQVSPPDDAVVNSSTSDRDNSEGEFDSRLTVGNVDPTKSYFVYFIHESGRSGNNMHIKVGHANDVGEYRKELEKTRENNLKTYIAIKCLKGDADSVADSFKQRFTSSHLKNGWYSGSKAMIDSFVDETVSAGYEKVTEGRAKILKSARKPAAKKSAPAPAQ